MNDFLMGIQSKVLISLIYGVIYLFFLLFCIGIWRRPFEKADHDENKNTRQ